MDKSNFEAWDFYLKTFALVGAIVGAIWAYHTYSDTKEKEFYSTFWNQKMMLYLETSQAAATMATTDSIDEFYKARTKYEELFYGRLSLVEGDNVKNAMMVFAPMVPKGEITKKDLPLVKLQQPAYGLTVVLKQELGHAWRKPFGEL